jgi:hypothetical protein
MSPESGNPAPGSPSQPRRKLMILRLLPILLLAAIAYWYFGKAPKEAELAYTLGDKREGLLRLEADVYALPQHSLVRHTELMFSPSSPAPAEAVQKAKLKPGTRYEIDVRLVYPDRSETIVRELSYDGEERYTLRL